MAKQKSLMLKIGVPMAVAGCILIAKPFANEPLWLQWIVGFALFYVGIPIAIVGAAIYFVGYKGAPQDPFSPPASAGNKHNQTS